MSDTESSAGNSDNSDEEVEEEEVEEEEDVDEEESEEGEEEEVEEEEEEEGEEEEDTDEENDENDESNDSDHDTDKSEEESDSEKRSTESESDNDSYSDEKTMGGPTVKNKLKESKEKTKIKTQPVEESPELKHKSDSDEDSNGDDNSESDNSESDKQQSGGKEKGLAAKIYSVRKESPELQQNSDSDDEQGSEGELKVPAPKIEKEDSKKETKIHPQHVEDKSMKIESPEFERKSDADDDSKSNPRRDEQESSGKVKDLAAKTGNKKGKEETKIKAQHVESVSEVELQQKSHSAKDSDGNDNSKSGQQESGRKVIGHAAKMENKESEKETEIRVQPVKSVRKESPELQQKSHSAKDSKGNDKSDKQEMKGIAAKTESKESKNETKIMAAQPVEDKSLKKEFPELRRISDSADNYKSDKQVMKVKVPAAKTEINESKIETKINTQPVEAESVRKQSSEPANKALPTEKKGAKKEDFSQTTGVQGKYRLEKYVQVDMSDVMSTRRVGTQTKLKHYNVCTFTSGLIKKVNMQTYTSGLISKSDHSSNTIQERGKDKKTQTKDKYVLERHLTDKYNDSSEKKTTENKDTTKKSGENENETSVQSKRSKVKIPLLKLSPKEESNSANSTENTEDRPPQPDSLSKKGTQSKDIKSNQKHQKTPLDSSGEYSEKEYDKKTRKEKENIRRRGRRRGPFCINSKRHPSREYIPKPSKNKTPHIRPTSAGPVYKRELINPIHRPGYSQDKILLVRPNSAGPVNKRQFKHPEGTPVSMAQYRMLYHHRWTDIPF